MTQHPHRRLRDVFTERPFEASLSVVLLETAAAGYLIRAATTMPTWLDLSFVALSTIAGTLTLVGMLGHRHLWGPGMHEAGLILGGAVYLSYTASITYPPWAVTVNALALTGGAAVSAAFWVRAWKVHKDRKATLDTLQQIVDTVEQAGGTSG